MERCLREEAFVSVLPAYWRRGFNSLYRYETLEGWSTAYRVDLRWSMVGANAHLVFEDVFPEKSRRTEQVPFYRWIGYFDEFLKTKPSLPDLPTLSIPDSVIEKYNAWTRAVMQIDVAQPLHTPVVPLRSPNKHVTLFDPYEPPQPVDRTIRKRSVEFLKPVHPRTSTIVYMRKYLNFEVTEEKERAFLLMECEDFRESMLRFAFSQMSSRWPEEDRTKVKMTRALTELAARASRERENGDMYEAASHAYKDWIAQRARIDEVERERNRLMREYEDRKTRLVRAMREYVKGYYALPRDE